MNAAISPCVGICRLDDETGYCLGCGRTGDEIATWSTAGPGGRRAIWAALPARLGTLGVGVRRLPWAAADVRGFILKTLHQGDGLWRLVAPGASATFPCPARQDLEIRSHGDIVEAVSAKAALRLHCGGEARAFAVDAGAAGRERIVLAVQANRPRTSPWRAPDAPLCDREAVRPAGRQAALRLVDMDEQGSWWGIRGRQATVAAVAAAATAGDHTSADGGDAADVVIATALGRIEAPLPSARLGADADPGPALPESFVLAACYEPEQ